MGETIDTKKVRLVSKITAIQDEALLDLLEKVFDSAPLTDKSVWDKVAKPIRRRQTISDMMKEQNFQKFDRAGFDHIIEQLDVQDPGEELLKSLTP